MEQLGCDLRTGRFTAPATSRTSTFSERDLRGPGEPGEVLSTAMTDSRGLGAEQCHPRVPLCVSLCVSEYLHVYVYVSVSVCVCVCVSMCMSVCLFMCLCVSVC